MKTLGSNTLNCMYLLMNNKVEDTWHASNIGIEQNNDELLDNEQVLTESGCLQTDSICNHISPALEIQ